MTFPAFPSLAYSIFRPYLDGQRFRFKNKEKKDKEDLEWNKKQQNWQIETSDEEESDEEELNV